MSCPYLTRVTMVYCRASPVRKYLSSDRLTDAGCCNGAAYRDCPSYREQRAASDDDARAPDGEGCPFAIHESKGVRAP